MDPRIEKKQMTYLSILLNGIIDTGYNLINNIFTVIPSDEIISDEYFTKDEDKKILNKNIKKNKNNMDMIDDDDDIIAELYLHPEITQPKTAHSKKIYKIPLNDKFTQKFITNNTLI